MALWSTLGMISCVGSRDGASLAAEEQAAIGVCGANADPVTGVMCSYTYRISLGTTYSFARSETFEQDGLDYVRCSWSVSCSTYTTPLSDSGASCVATIGTGCNEGNLAGTLTQVRLLPAGTTADKVDAFCQTVEPASSDRDAFCTSLNHTTEQYEDLCCVARKKVETNPIPE